MRKTNTGLLALAAIGGFYIYRNRSSIMSFLESKGFNLPLLTKNIDIDGIKSDVAKTAGKVLHTVDRSVGNDQQVRKAI